MTGVRFTSLARWGEKGHLLPWQRRPGTGYFRWFDEREIACVRALQLLAPPQSSVPISPAIRPIIEAIRKASALAGHVVVAVQGKPPVVVPEAEASTITSAALAEGRTVTLVDGDRLAA